MEKHPSPDLPSKGQFLIYQSEDGRMKIDVRLEGETVWLTQQHIADLFQTTQQNISLHLQNIYDEGELQREATHKEFLSVSSHGDTPRAVRDENSVVSICSGPKTRLMPAWGKAP